MGGDGNGDGGDGGDGGDDGDGGDGGGNGGTASGGGKTITIWTDQAAEAEREVWQALGEEFEEETDHTVEFTFAGFDEGAAELSQLARGGNPPEIATSLTGELIGFSQQFKPIEMTDRIPRFSDYPEFRYYEDDVGIKTVPLHNIVSSTAIRQDLVEQVGGTIPEDPQEHVSWETFQEWMTAIDDQTDTRGVAINTGPTYGGNLGAKPWAWSNGTTLYEGEADDVQVVMDQGQNRERLTAVIEYLGELHSTSPTAIDWGTGDNINSYVSGSIAASTNLNAALMGSVAANSNETVYENTVFMQQPLGPSGSNDQTHNWMGGTDIAIFRQSDNPMVAEEFLAHMYNSDTYNIDWMATAPLHQVPNTPKTIESDEFQSFDFVQENPRLVSHIRDTLANPGKHLEPVATSDFNVSQPLSIVANQGVIPNMYGLHIHDGMSPGDAIDQTAEEARNILSEN